MDNQELELRIAIEMVSFDYYKECILNGATDEEAKKEMMSEKGQLEMAKRIKEILK